MAHDFPALQLAVEDALEVKETLLDERAANRDTMSKAAFRIYNKETRAQHLQVQAGLDTAEQALQAANLEIRNDATAKAIVVDIGTISETDTAGGVT